MALDPDSDSTAVFPRKMVAFCLLSLLRCFVLVRCCFGCLRATWLCDLECVLKLTNQLSLRVVQIGAETDKSAPCNVSYCLPCVSLGARLAIPNVCLTLGSH